MKRQQHMLMQPNNVSFAKHIYEISTSGPKITQRENIPRTSSKSRSTNMLHYFYYLETYLNQISAKHLWIIPIRRVLSHILDSIIHKNVNQARTKLKSNQEWIPPEFISQIRLHNTPFILNYKQKSQLFRFIEKVMYLDYNVG
jgi:hypothetical protein